ncbi:hypothetical protein Q3V23_08990 [Streptomyces sp. VNUA116]|uniref:hypothetical protein n=1 Tax=Streptomyces sp. VNUA116 TaxID=3062449 RepID=UPI002675E851|nr:hypothetical protein [Streptomyces sp. VNUA116]WKU44207.1 hypothetical protein Q3V23_08990 [Streptomyces sp. VNUA116]
MITMRAVGKAALCGAVVARGVYEGARRRRTSAAAWERTNHAGRTVHLHAGPAAAAGTALAVAAAAGLPPRVRAAGALTVAAAAACGAYDDFAGAGDPRRGFRAHLGALRRGEVTSGAVKLIGIGAAACAAGAVVKERPLDKALAAVVIAGSAHLVNLLDVRPGRAAGAVLALAAPGLARRGSAPLAAAPMGAAAALIADDLAERTMLGDTGAHALGAGLGLAVAVGNGRAGLALHAAALVGTALAMDARNHLCE